ncbi:hypothetical protein [Flammeovirga aprica]|uniref:Uncharacterized protein n=1 Tax=Flammeovirga aprica JL-4 TaxID=694437 RepID=A0A7X9P0W4_9BACT|nr:hypothetical protein [Flammeovirga aprica]NME67183.1 hypothetical protein [Flammeovirga aprica JL-4]
MPKKYYMGLKGVKKEIDKDTYDMIKGLKEIILSKRRNVEIGVKIDAKSKDVGEVTDLKIESK